MLSHIFDKFPHHEFVIAAHHLKSQVMDYIALAHPEHKVTYVDVGSLETPCAGPGLSLMMCLEEARDSSLVVTCDTYFNLPVATPFSNNWLGVATVNPAEAISYCNLEVRDGNVIKVFDKSIDPNMTHTWTGLMFIHDWHIALQNLQSRLPFEQEIQCSDAWAHLSLSVVGHEWIDVGTKARYISALEAEGYDYSKPHECTYVLDSRVIKFFTDAKRKPIRSSRQQNELINVTPKEIPCSSNNFAAYEKARGSTFYKNGSPSLFKSFLNWMRAEVWSEVESNDSFKLECIKFYKDKTQERIGAFLDKHPNCDFDKVNGYPLAYDWDSILAMIDWDKLVEDSHHVGFHGDLNFDNIIVNDGEFTLIDWRDSFGNVDLGGDIYYEYAKLLSGITFDFDLVKLGQFNIIDMHGDAIVSFSRRTINDEYEELLMRDAATYSLDWGKIDLLRWLILAGMSGLHRAPYSIALYYFSLWQVNMRFPLLNRFLVQD